MQVVDVAQILRCCGCSIGWLLQLRFDPQPGNLYMHGKRQKNNNNKVQVVLKSALAFACPWALSCLLEHVYSFPSSQRHVESLLLCHCQSLPVEPIANPPLTPPRTTAPDHPNCRSSMFLFYWAYCFPDDPSRWTFHSPFQIKFTPPYSQAGLQSLSCPANTAAPTKQGGGMGAILGKDEFSKFIRHKHLFAFG